MSDTNKALAALRADIEKALLSGYNEIKLQNIVGGARQTAQAEPPLFEGLADYARDAQMASRRKAHYYVVSRVIQRYGEYIGRTLLASETSIEDIEGLETFMASESRLQETAQYQKRVQSKAEQIKERGSNRVVVMMKIVRAYFNHLHKVGAIAVSPFVQYTMKGEVYGTPYYLTSEELGQIYSAPSRWQTQRDVFVFQCCVGCRVSDLQRLTWDNVETDSRGVMWVAYIPRKTANERAQVARIPLNAMAVGILGRYKDCPGYRLLPCISVQKYNDSIKRILAEAGIERKVTIRDPKTGESKQERICDIASSHMARRTFCGGMYNDGIDSRIICSMSGHVEGSKAFSRYSTPSDEQLINAVMNR